MYKFEIKNELSQRELVEYFNILKSHLIGLYGEKSVETGYKSWYENRSKFSPQKFFVKMFKDKELLGYAELLIRGDNTLYFCDIIIKEKSRQTRLVFEFVKFVLNCNQFKGYDEIYMHINRNNEMSLKTWSHFNYQKLEEQNLSNLYKISREDIANYINRLENFKNSKNK